MPAISELANTGSILTRHPVAILEKDPTNPAEAGAVCNPTVLLEPDGLHRMPYRAINGTKWHVPGNYVSTIPYRESMDGITFSSWSRPLIVPDQRYEYDEVPYRDAEHPGDGLGCEDPRMTRIGNRYFIFYTAVEGPFNGKDEATKDDMVKRDRIALATTTDLEHIQKHGVIGPDVTSKAAMLFPEKINGKYVMLYTLNSDKPQSSVMIAEFDRVEDFMQPGALADNAAHFDDNVLLRSPEGAHRGYEGGPVPLKTKDGWLLILSDVNMNGDNAKWTVEDDEWVPTAMLLNLEDPRRIIARSRVPLLRPETPDETQGNVKKVIFASGAVIHRDPMNGENDELFLYYGRGDTSIGLARGTLSRIMGYLEDVKN
jgi:predicted GH43/DUF377 family glycosyl hydrolase